MLQKLGVHIAEACERAVAAEHRAAMAYDESVRADYQRLAESWRSLAQSYLFVESLERFLLDAKKAKDALPPAHPKLE